MLAHVVQRTCYGTLRTWVPFRNDTIRVHQLRSETGRETIPEQVVAVVHREALRLGVTSGELRWKLEALT
jgi:hypothetical protein